MQLQAFVRCHKGSPRPTGGGKAPARGGRSGAARRCRAIATFTFLAICSPVSANEFLKQQTFDLLNACSAGISELNDLLATLGQVGWTRVPKEGDVTEFFSALETEGIDISNGSARTYAPEDFEGTVLFQNRLMLLLRDGDDAVAFIPSTPFGDELMCSLALTLRFEQSELEIELENGLGSLRQTQVGELFYNSGAHQLRINQMPDGSSKPVSGATTYVILTTDL